MRYIRPPVTGHLHQLSLAGTCRLPKERLLMRDRIFRFCVISALALAWAAILLLVLWPSVRPTWLWAVYTQVGLIAAQIADAYREAFGRKAR